ncbi:MAG TPA: phosphate ABC transporter permease subunit PstC [Spirochaetia bacterium]|nr:phosphate ABC transporter permease subunit PstC [Spirochaetia bacterium]
MNGDKVFRVVLTACTSLIALITLGIFITLLQGSLPSIEKFGFAFLTTAQWNPVKVEFGGLQFIVGTLATSVLALAISLPFSLGIAVLLGEYYQQGRFARFLQISIDLLASIPSVIYGFWGLTVLVPLVRRFEIAIHVTPYGVGIFTSSLILAIMIVPYSSSIATEVIRLVPREMKDASYALGSTRFEVIKNVTFNYAKSGIIAGVMLSLGRALGETMAVTMVIGNNYRMPKGIFDPGNTLASVIASEFTEAMNPIHLSAMIELALVLFLITMILNLISRRIIARLGGGRRG